MFAGALETLARALEGVAGVLVLGFFAAVFVVFFMELYPVVVKDSCAVKNLTWLVCLLVLLFSLQLLCRSKS